MARALRGGVCRESAERELWGLGAGDQRVLGGTNLESWGAAGVESWEGEGEECWGGGARVESWAETGVESQEGAGSDLPEGAWPEPDMLGEEGRKEVGPVTSVRSQKESKGQGR